MNTILKKYFQYSCKALVGIVFCVSAILKMLTIESFEIYIFSFQCVGLSVSYIIARIIICLELILGVALVLNIYKRQIYIATVSVLSVFTLFLVYMYFFKGNEGNCHCFGDAVQLNPLHSIAKNVVLIGLVLASHNVAPFKFNREKLIAIILSAVVFLSVFIASPPDNWLSFNNAEINKTALNETFDLGVLNKNEILNGTQIVSFYGVGCQYCKLAHKKLEVIQQNHPELTMNIVGVFWGGNEKYANFIKNSTIPFSKTFRISPVPFLKITNGSMPILLIVENGEITKILNYRNINEEVLLRTFGKYK